MSLRKIHSQEKRKIYPFTYLWAELSTINKFTRTVEMDRLSGRNTSFWEKCRQGCDSLSQPEPGKVKGGDRDREHSCFAHPRGFTFVLNLSHKKMFRERSSLDWIFVDKCFSCLHSLFRNKKFVKQANNSVTIILYCVGNKDKVKITVCYAM